MSRQAPSPRDMLLGHLASLCVAALALCGLAVLCVPAVRYLAAM